MNRQNRLYLAALLISSIAWSGLIAQSPNAVNELLNETINVHLINSLGALEDENIYFHSDNFNSDFEFDTTILPVGHRYFISSYKGICSHARQNIVQACRVFPINFKSDTLHMTVGTVEIARGWSWYHFKYTYCIIVGSSYTSVSWWFDRDKAQWTIVDTESWGI